MKNGTKKKIFYFVTQSDFGGVQHYIYSLAASLKDEFEVVAAGGEEGEKGELARRLSEAGIKFHALKNLKRTILLLSDFLAVFEIIGLIRKEKPDIIHLNSSKASIIGSIAGRLALGRKVKIVYTVHGWVFNEPMPGARKACYLWAERFTARFKDKLICVSEFDRQIALKNKIAPEKKLTTIHNGMETVDFIPREKARETLSSKIQTSKIRDQESFVILSIGNLYATKGFEYFIQAADLLKANKNFEQAVFIIIGEGGERPTLEALIKNNSLEEKFFLAGGIEKAACLLAAADLYVCSSVKEGFPYSIIEAMQAGLPIVSTEVGGIPEMIKNGKNGLLVRAANAADLAERIKRLAEDKTYARKIAREAAEDAKKKFTLKEMIDKTRILYLD